MRNINAGTMLLTLFLLAACSSGRLSDTPGKPVEMPDEQKKTEGLEAPLFSKGGSGAQGKVNIVQRGDKWLVSVTLFSVLSGSYRMAFFDNGNCSSPNAFSAGNLWLPPGAPADAAPDRWVPLLYANQNGRTDTVFRLPNPGERKEEVFRKRSVLIFAGDTAEPLKPSVRNDVVACGVFDSIDFLF